MANVLLFNKCFLSEPHISLTLSAYEAMDIYSRQIAIGFAEWKDGQGFECTLHDDENIKHWQAYGEGKLYTTDQLYEEFEKHLQSLNK